MNDEHEVARLRTIASDRLAQFNREPIVPQPTVLVTKLQLALIELDVLKGMIFSGEFQTVDLEQLGINHAKESLERFIHWLDEVIAEAGRQRLASRLIVPPNGN